MIDRDTIVFTKKKKFTIIKMSFGNWNKITYCADTNEIDRGLLLLLVECSLLTPPLFESRSIK